MRRDLSNFFYHLTPSLSGRGGISQPLSPQGGSATRAALSCLGKLQEVAPADPPPPPLETGYAVWVSDEGWLYTPTLHQDWTVPLSRILLVKVKDAMDVWRVGLEAIQTGLFPWAFLRPSRLCPVNYLRKLQITAERVRSQVFVLCRFPLPHWVLKKTNESPLPASLGPPEGLQRSLSRAHS